MIIFFLLILILLIPQTPVPTHVRVVPDSPSLRVGETVQLSAVVLDQYDTAMVGPVIAWKPDQAQQTAWPTCIVQMDGLVTATREGQCGLRAVIVYNGRLIFSNQVLVSIPEDTRYFPTPTPTPTPSSTPTPEPSPTPSPPSCSITAPALIVIPRNGSGVINISLNNMTVPVTITVLGSSGQVTVAPLTRTVNGTSAVSAFGLYVKRQSRDITFSSPCGDRAVRVNVL